MSLLSRAFPRAHAAVVPLASTLAALALAAGVLATPCAARAQAVTCDDTADFPCGYQLRDVKLQRVPPVLKFQARVSQAKLPLGEGVFNTVFVKLLRGTEVLCLEQFENVQVRGSVLNLEVGRNMSCELGEVLAENAGLRFQVCPGGQDSCLPPIELGAAPYAIKASYAAAAQDADHANVAGQASYAQRATADRDLYLRKTLGTGYFDFYTHPAEQCVELYPNPADYAPYEGGGFLQWTPVRDRGAMNLHIAGKRHGTDSVTELDTLKLVSEDTYATGDLTVTPSPGGKGLTVTAQGAHVVGDSDVDGQLVVTQRTEVQSGGVHVVGDSEVDGAVRIAGRTDVQSGGVHVVGDSEVAGTLTVSQAMTVQSGGLDVTGDSDVAGTLTVGQRLTVQSGGAQVTGDSQVDGTLTVSAATTVQSGGVQVTGDSSVTGALDVGGPLTVQSGGADITGATAISGDLSVTGSVSAGGSAKVGGDLELDGALSMRASDGALRRIATVAGLDLVLNPDDSLSGTRVQGPVRFTGPVVFDGGTTDPSAADQFVLAFGEDRDLTLGGALAVVGTASFPGGVTGGLNVQGDVSVSGAATVAGAATLQGGLTVAGGVTYQGAATYQGPATFQGPVTMPGGIAGDVTLTGGLTVAQATTLSGGLTVAGGATLQGPTTFTGAANFQGGVTASTLRVSGASTFDGAVSLPGGVSGAVDFGSNISVAGTATLAGNASVGGNLTINGTTTFNGPVNLGSTFAGLTSFERVSVTQNLNVAGLAVFQGSVDFQGQVTGTTTFDTVVVNTGLTANGWTIFKGPVDLSGATITGITIPNANDYVKAVGETRTITLPGLVVSGNALFNQVPTFGAGLGDVTVTKLSATDVDVTGSFSAPRCRICINYSDLQGANPADRKHVCVRMIHGGSSGLLNLAGNVNDDDVLEIVFVCDGGSDEAGPGWI